MQINHINKVQKFSENILPAQYGSDVSSDGGLAMPDCCYVKIVEFYRTHNGLAKPQALQEEFSLETVQNSLENL
uniref:Uncharacterized protein n=1 Tax=Glossina palpalis gambiensis TaxID=67801 RepID=A0A1B0BJS2_9MUSC